MRGSMLLTLIVSATSWFYVRKCISTTRSHCPFTSERRGAMLLGEVFEKLSILLTFCGTFVYRASMGKQNYLSTCLTNIWRWKLFLFFLIFVEMQSGCCVFPETLNVQICVSECRRQSCQTFPNCHCEHRFPIGRGQFFERCPCFRQVR